MPVEIVKQFSKEKRMCCCIPVEKMKTILVEPDGSVRTSCYYPTIEVTKTSLKVSYDGTGIGRSYVE
jgi:hypothetical protein